MVRRWIAVVLAAVLAGGLLAACSASVQTGSEPRPGPINVTGPDADLADPGKAQGHVCRRVAPRDIADPDYWFDDSPVVPCSQPHNVETVAVLDAAAPSVSEAKHARSVCWELALRYVGIDETHWIPWQPLVFLPSRAQVVAGGTATVRCDIAFPLSDRPLRVRRTTWTARDAAHRHAEALWACTDSDPRTGTLSYLPCTRPHRFEATGRLALLFELPRYPSPARLEREESQCLHGLPARQRRRGIEAIAAWDSPKGFTGGILAGVCFVHRTDGRPLPPRQAP
ncbi:hypothetical protein FB382_001902 [Nocardioides ginsengisegetis]|uniref:Septum formation n=1 Tax=Nocardioides ginsengisegetis TaxID=661491 RepID=A0A7W3IZQ8_9ACTN|nr:hypothetical protein [Nocardioides ginsengisegetis]MBA8803611.1 hypothetical protein [Nocardioides ginsengisegetis]